MMNGINDELILAARLLLATLFLIFGWRKVRDYSGLVLMDAKETVVPVVSIAVKVPGSRNFASTGESKGSVGYLRALPKGTRQIDVVRSNFQIDAAEHRGVG